ncbi:MAG TPA: VOC family protein [Xanthobacteraceae bacterium]|jgi:PhnB protein|nr:VOC family protein [Xanthobacteraceae bacterium]
MNETVQPAVTAYLTVKGGLDAIALYRRAFGAELLTHKMTDDGRRVQHAALSVFGTMIMLSDEFPEYDPGSKAPTTLGATTFTLHVGFDGPAEVDAAMSRAAAAGCAVTTPPADVFWGMRYGRLTDPFGHAWAFGAPLRATAQGHHA